MTTPPEHPQSPAVGPQEAPVKEPILMNWIIIVVTLGVICFVALKLTGS